MNGIIAAAFWASSLLNPVFPLYDGISQRPANPETVIQISNKYFQKNLSGQELGFYSTGSVYYGPLKPMFSASITDKGGFWMGAGFENDLVINETVSATFTFMPGVYARGDDENLGGWLMFRSGIGLKVKYSDEICLSVVLDHRSSGDIWEYNPGMETIQIKLHKKVNF